MAAIASAKLLHVPVVVQVHGINMGVIHLLIRPRWLARLYRAYHLFLQKESIKKSDCVICVSEDNKRYLPIGEKTVIPMGINTTLFQVAQNSTDIREELGIPEDAFTLGYVGALSAGKGLHMLLESFYYILQEMPQASTYLLIVGDGPEKKSLEDLAGKLGVRQYLRLTGFRADVARLLSVMDVFVFPSESEGSPIAILEAMAAGKAIIASDIPSIREIANHGEEAILVNRHNVEELKRAILSLYNNSNLRVKLGQRAKERAKSYDVERVYCKILKVYTELIHRRTK
jgi:glycosyltransferase involved in cell wall biosynthesis